MTDKSKTDFWQQQADLDIKGLINALSSDDILIRRRATAALQAMQAITALSALQRAQIAENDPETGKMMEAAISALKVLSGHSPAGLQTKDKDTTPLSPQSGVAGLIEDLKAASADTVLNAAEKLGELGNKIAVEALILAFSNQKHSIHVRLAIAEALLKLESAPVEVALLANIRHSDWHIRRNGAAILGQLKAEWAIEPLSRTLNDPHPVVRRTALAALKHIGTPESRKALAQFVPGTGSLSAKKQEAPSQVSGIEVKRPGQQSSENDNSPLLKRLERERLAAERARLGTQPLDPEVLKRNQKRIEATQPIPDNMLDQLDLMLDDEDEDGDDV